MTIVVAQRVGGNLGVHHWDSRLVKCGQCTCGEQLEATDEMYVLKHGWTESTGPKTKICKVLIFCR